MSRRGGRRAGAGCKRRLDGGQVLSFYADAETLDKINIWCKHRKLSRSEAIRRMVCLAHRDDERKDGQ
jgi:hypothetical protein